MLRNAALFSIVMMSLAPLGCATTVHPGLANAPALGGSPVADVRVHDVVANGRDSCERKLGPGPLRDEVPPCQTVERTPDSPVVTGPTSSEKVIVMPWVEHYYSRAACFSSENEPELMTMARTLPYTASDHPLSAMTCWPL
jgi:hypothetical protein